MQFASAQVSEVSPHRCALGESPTWSPEDRRLYWIDIPRGQVLSVDKQGADLRVVGCGEPIGALVRLAGGGMALFTMQGRVRRLDNGRRSSALKVLDGQEKCRFNDAVTDPAGRVLCGSMELPNRQRGFASRWSQRIRRLTGIASPARAPHGSIHGFDVDGTTRTLIPSLGRPNGMGFSPDGRLLYVTDSVPGHILVLEYDASTGQAGNAQTFATIDAAEGRPDGLAVDSDGCVWSAIMNGGCVLRLDPKGNRMGRLVVPTPKVTSVAFGGEEGTRLYVTTAGGKAPAELAPAAGRLFSADLGVSGLPDHAARIPLPPRP